MLSRARTVRLCHGCRWDLQVLFERGFCSVRPALTSPVARPQWRSRRVNFPQCSQPLSTTFHRLQQDDRSRIDPPAIVETEPSGNAYSRLERLADLERKLDELHKRLYDSVQQAVDEVQP